MSNAFFLKTILVLSFWMQVAFVQAQGKLIATTDAQKVEVGYTIGVSFEIENTDARAFVAPKFEGFKVVSGPNRSVSTTIIQGKMSQRQVWAYLLIALEVGQKTIGTASVQTSGGELKSQPIQIEVKPAGAATGTAKSLAQKGEKVFIQAKLETDTAYIGQSIRLEHLLFAKVPVESYQLLQEPAYPGFFAQQMQRFDVQSGQKDLANTQYATRILHAVSLIPQHTGLIQVPSSSYQLGVLAEQKTQGNQRDPFNRYLSRVYQPTTINTTSAQLVVLDLPSPAPAAFCGLVGKYQVSSQVDKASITTDEAFLITLKLVGNGDPKKLKLPELKVPEGLEAYPPKLVNDEPYESDNQGFFHEATIEYYIVPQVAGQYAFTPELVVFDPNTQAYRTIAGQECRVNVAKGTGLKLPHNNQKQDKTGVQLTSILFWLIPALCLGFVGFYLFKRSKQPIQPNQPKKQIYHPQPEKQIAHEPLTPTITQPKPIGIDTNQSPQNFYRDLEILIRNQWNTAKTDTSTEQTEQSPATQLAEMLKLCEKVQYGRAKPSQSNEDILQEVHELLKQV
jgi:hypothetical protein